jgi:uncharacterized protein YecT (DUF1311 family)
MGVVVLMVRSSRSRRSAGVARVIPSLLGLMLGVVVSGMAAPSARADSQAIDTQTTTCMDQAMGTAAMLACLAQGRQAWERELERTLPALASRLPPQDQRVLEASQHRWQAYRDAQAQLLGATFGPMDGGLYRVLHASDRLEIVRARTLALAGLVRLLDEQNPRCGIGNP